MLRFFVVAVIAISVIGCAGPVGPTGPQGSQGEKGDTGATGQTGAGTRVVFTGRLDSNAMAGRSLPSYVGTVNDPPVISVYVSPYVSGTILFSLEQYRGSDGTVYGYFLGGVSQIGIVLTAAGFRQRLLHDRRGLLNQHPNTHKEGAVAVGVLLC